jgi:hypothetical protein
VRADAQVPSVIANSIALMSEQACINEANLQSFLVVSRRDVHCESQHRQQCTDLPEICD